MISRLAPTPNGEIHWGNLMNFALTWAYVAKAKGELWLRFDDIDRERCQEHFKDETKELLGFLGLSWQHEAPSQATKLDRYKDFLNSIPHYVCSCSRKQIEERTGSYHYDGFCRDKKHQYKAGTNAIRFFHPSSHAGDFILWRREDLPSYHLTSVFDDQEMKIDFIVRGEDLLESTQIQRELSKAIANDPLSQVKFVHHRLLLNEDGEKMAKSRKDGELFQLFKKGLSAKDIWLMLGQKMQTQIPLTCAQDLLKIDLDQYKR